MHTKKSVVFGLLLLLVSCPAWAQVQQMAIPSYFGPGPLWTKLANAAPRVGLAIINPNSGPGNTVRQDYVAQVKAVQAQGVTVLGYVHTSYAKRPLAEVKAEIDRYRRWYGVDGIFFDEVTNDDAGLPYYVQCHDAAMRVGHPKGVIVINPGTPVTEGYMAVANVVLTFESDYNAYLKRDPDAAWVAHYPAKRFYHLIYNVPDVASMQKAVGLSKQRNAGWFYATPDNLPNPWDTLPDGDYWTGELSALGTPLSLHLQKSLIMSMKKSMTGYLFIAPWLVGFLAFTAYPFLASIALSFTRYNIVQKPVWVATANYHTLLTQDPLFWKSLLVTAHFALLAVPIAILAGVSLALLLNLDLRGMGVYRTIFFLPSILPTVATSVVFLWLFNPEIGLINRLLKAIGLPGPEWLQSTTWALPSLVLLSLWAVGGSMVIYLAGLKDIPAHLYEAATIDGASAWQRLRFVTLPMLSPVIFFNLVMGLIGVFQYFTEAYIMTQGGPEDSTHFYALYLFERAWRYLDMGYASAMAWVLFVVIMAMTGVLFWTQRRWVHYEG